MPLIAYLDEAGDHSLDRIDSDFPVFTLVMLVANIDTYVSQIVPAVCRFKIDHFGHEGVILHSRDIRKAQGPFTFLTNPQSRPSFYQRINDLMSQNDYTLIVAVINKRDLKGRYGIWARHPYDLALTFAMERLLPLLEDAHESGVNIIAESRGRQEDRDLELRFLQIINYGTEYNPATRFANFQFRLTFLPKAMNIVGTQLADLVAYPVARHCLNPNQQNPAYDIVQTKFYMRRGNTHYGLKIFP